MMSKLSGSAGRIVISTMVLVLIGEMLARFVL